VETARTETGQEEIVSEQGDTEVRATSGQTLPATDDDALRDEATTDADPAIDASQERSTTTRTGSEAAPESDGERTSLLGDEGDGFWTRWEQIQVRFVDEPRQSVEQADALVLEVTQRLTSMFDQERTTLEGRWGSGDDVSTEDLRVALQRYRSFFERLLSA